MTLVRGATFSDDGLHRYTLFRTIDLPQPVLDKGLAVFVMLNPSKADAMADDPTIEKCVRFAKSWGFSRLKVVNLFAWRETNPKNLAKAQEGGKDTTGSENDYVIEATVREAALVVCAWGNGSDLKRSVFSERVSQVCEILHGTRRLIHVLALTDRGQPHHPLYLADDTTPRLWNPTL